MKTLLLAQALISFMMATLMTGFFSFLALGFSDIWPAAWFHNFIIAWPVAFCLSLVVGKVAFAIAHRVFPAVKA